ncbi:MAG: MFS transporter [Pseudomonadota bacterium]
MSASPSRLKTRSYPPVELAPGAEGRPSPGSPPGLWLRIFLPFAAGYYLSYLLRTVNAVLAPELTRELGLSATHLGLLTSAYFLAFGACQLPLGLALDRYGARRVEAALLLFAAAGALLFAVGDSLGLLIVGRALIGLGVSACLMGALKCLFEWFPPERHASLTGAIMASGGLGALSASVPLTWLLPAIGWRGVFIAAAAFTLLVIAALWTVPERSVPRASEPLGQQLRAVAGIFRTAVFWRFGLQMGVVAGATMALQGLWAVPWLMTVNGYSRTVAADHLFLMSTAMLAGFLGVAAFATPLARRGMKPVYLLGGGIALVLVASLAILFDLGDTRLTWLLLGFGASTGNLAYAQLSAHFPPQLSGRVSTAINLLAFAGAFSLQWGFGALVDALLAAGWASAAAYRASFTVLLVLEAVAFVWFIAGDRIIRKT